MNTARTRFGLAVTGMAAMIAGGCSPQPAAEHQPAAVAECATPGIEASVAGVDRCSAESVLRAAITTIFSYRPHEQPDQQVAFGFARELMTPSFAHQAQPAALVWAPITTEQWQHWRADGIAITAAVRLTRDDHPPDTATSTHRVLSVQLQPGDEPFVVFGVYARATRASTTASWLLAGLEVNL
ncbi:hypothetical protein [Nocardia brasiliensis]|uniref:hypothetical protein n=1 Tax=Nocardia brasiliensis TaxID=37326 RepID=UPI001894FF56|nr:hypothetical protein [Nocardia brasiliensis]MBF6125540.1 hypothetical protein [Nocardia brasiliensis]